MDDVYEFPNIPESTFDEVGGTVNHRRTSAEIGDYSHSEPPDTGAVHFRHESGQHGMQNRRRGHPSGSGQSSLTPADSSVPASQLHDGLVAEENETKREFDTAASILSSALSGQYGDAVRRIFREIEHSHLTGAAHPVSAGGDRAQDSADPTPRGTAESKASGTPTPSGPPSSPTLGSSHEHAANFLPPLQEIPAVWDFAEAHRYHKLHEHHGRKQHLRGAIEQAGMPFGFSEQMSNTEPTFEHIEGGTRITHRSLIATPTAKPGEKPTIIKFPINPGLDGVFPWVNTIARRFQKYSVNELKFRYVNRTAATASGTVAFSSSFDPGQPDPTTLMNAMQSEYAVDGVIWEELTWPDFSVKSDRDFKRAMKRRRFVRSSPQGNDVVSLYDALNVFFIIQGSSITTPNAIGDLWIEYSIDLYHPHVGPVAIQPHRLAIFQTTTGAIGSTVATAIALTTVEDPFGLTPQPCSAPTLGEVTTGARLLPAGLWLITARAAIVMGAVSPVGLILEIRTAPLGTTLFSTVATFTASTQQTFTDAAHTTAVMSETPTFAEVQCLLNKTVADTIFEVRVTQTNASGYGATVLATSGADITLAVTVARA